MYERIVQMPTLRAVPNVGPIRAQNLTLDLVTELSHLFHRARGVGPKITLRMKLRHLRGRQRKSTRARFAAGPT